MNFAEIVEVIEEISSLYQEIKADGTFDKIKAGEEALAAEWQNPKVVALIAKLKTIKL